MASSSVSIADTLKVTTASAPPSYSVRRAISLSSLLRVTNVLSRTRVTTLSLRSVLRLTPRQTPASRFGLSLRSTLKLATNRLSTGLGARLSSTLRLHPTQRLTQATALRSTLKVAMHTGMVAHYRLALQSTLRLTGLPPSYARLVYLHSTLALHASVARTYRGVAKMASVLNLHMTATPHLAIVIAHADTLKVHETDILKWIYSGQLADTVDFAVDIFDPGSDTTAWAVNARTGAVTEYLNYGFSAFASGPNGPYLGANGGGLFELAGPDDAGSPVIADLIGGLTDFGGTFLSGFKAAYLAVRGSGQYFLKVTSGDGSTYVYGVNATSLKTSRVNMGKGIRARFFTFELLSTGQDFDLVGLTFLPIQATRRI